MITPLHGHLVVEPIIHDSFISSQKETFDEIGIVISMANDVFKCSCVEVGQKVFFDSFMCSKYPNPDKPDSFVWFVPHTECKGSV